MSIGQLVTTYKTITNAKEFVIKYSIPPYSFCHIRGKYTPFASNV